MVQADIGPLLRTLAPCSIDQAFYRALVASTLDSSVSVWRNNTQVFLCASPETLCVDRDPCTALASFANAVDRQRAERSASDVPWFPLALGWVGYDAMRLDEPSAVTDSRSIADCAPHAALLRFNAVLRVSLEDQSVSVCAGNPEDEQRLVTLWEKTVQTQLAPIAEVDVHSDTSKAQHCAAILQVIHEIREGEVYLVNIAQVLHSHTALSDQQLAARVFRANSNYGAILRGEGVRIGAMSMELGLAVNRLQNTVQTHPIKGTRPRSQDPIKDRALAEELEQSPKERAENVMAVDVHRNDMGKFANVGTVQVYALCSVQSHHYVHHLVSQISCKISDETSTLDILTAMAPVGSVTGAPKRAAMQTIAKLERERRGLYTGFYGAVWPDGSMELAVAIRTMVVDSSGTHFGCGGGIVYDSDPENEWQELQWKQRGLSGKLSPTS